MSLKQKPSTKLNLKVIFIYAIIGGGVLGILTYIGLTFFGIIGVPKKVFAEQQVTGYSWDAIITIDHTKVSGTANLIDFPVEVSIINDALKSVSNGGKVENINGFDIFFSDMDNNQLEHQIESYNPLTGEYVAWVKIPLLSATEDTEFKMLYGNLLVSNDPSTSNVWNSNYEGVWHMNNDPSNVAPQLIDGTTNARNGESFGTMTTSNSISGKIGLAIEFDGIDDYFNINNYKGVTGIAERTVSMWFKSNAVSYDHRLISWGGSKEGEKYNIKVNGNNNSLETKVKGGHIKGTTNISDGNWHYLSVVLPNNTTQDVQDHLLYVDGVLETNTSGRNVVLNTEEKKSVLLGKGNGGCCFTNGIIDEVRIANTSFSADWIATEYNNQNSPNTFYSIVFGSSPIELAVLPIELTTFDVQLIDNSVEVTWITATEKNNDFFTIEKSIDGIDFEIVDELPGAGNSQELLNYRYIDNNVYGGVSYYRLKQTDFNGEFKYFPPKSVNSNSQGTSFKISNVVPNPFSSQFYVLIESEKSGLVDLTLTNINGVEISKIKIELSKGETKYEYPDANQLNSGTYIVKLTNEETSVSYRVIKK